MARLILTKPKMLFLRSLRGVGSGGRYMGNLAAQDHGHQDHQHQHQHQLTKYSVHQDDQSFWVPHPRTGIYYPKGNERLMDDVPNLSASFDQTYWLRGGDDGVEKPLPEVSLKP